MGWFSRLFSFGNKENVRGKRASRDRSTVSAYEDGPNERQDAMLDPLLPEKRRARRRLVGAIALIIAAIVILPMVLDSHPKPETDDIAIQIPKSLFENCSEHPLNEQSAAYSRICENVVPRAPLESKDALDNLPAAKSDQPSPSAALSKANQQQAAQSLSTNKKSSARPTPAPQSTPAVTAPSEANAMPRIQTSTNVKSGHHFVIQLGAFSDEQRAQSRLNQLKKINVSAYLERNKQDNHQELWLVRAGPFSDRASAQAALKRMRDAGLSVAADKTS